MELLEEKNPWEPNKSSVLDKEGLSFNNQVSGQSETTTNELILERTNARGHPQEGSPNPRSQSRLAAHTTKARALPSESTRELSEQVWRSLSLIPATRDTEEGGFPGPKGVFKAGLAT